MSKRVDQGATCWWRAAWRAARAAGVYHVAIRGHHIYKGGPRARRVHHELPGRACRLA